MAIFVNYRRDDSASITGRIDDHLRAQFGASDVYRDIDSIPLGVDFVKHLQNAIRQCDVCIAVIGQSWVSDRLRLDDDWVRLELEIALNQEIPVIPVLVEGADLPTREQIPGSLLPLLRRQAMRVDSGPDFTAHVQRLVDSIRSARDEAQGVAKKVSVKQPDDRGKQQRRWQFFAFLFLTFVLATTAVVFALLQGQEDSTVIQSGGVNVNQSDGVVVKTGAESN